MRMHLLKIVVAIQLIWRSSVASSTSTDPLSFVNPLPASLENVVQRAKRDLTASGYEVARVYLTSKHTFSLGVEAGNEYANLNDESDQLPLL